MNNNLDEQIINLKSSLDNLKLIRSKINLSIDLVFETIQKKKKIFICGNGGSASHAQHLAAEYLIRLRPEVNRRPFPVISLALDTSTITACGNDYKFEDLFARNLEALANKKDLLIVISTSGNSKNIIKVLNKARKMGLKIISFLGNRGGKAKNRSDIDLLINEKNVARIQEVQMFLGHYIFEKAEDKLIKYL